MAKSGKSARNTPPVAHQFKKGQPSACPDGGWPKKRAKQKAREEAEAKHERAKSKRLVNIVRRVGLEEHTVNTPRGPMKFTKVELLIRKAIDRGLAKDATDRQLDRALKLMHETGLLDAKEDGVKSGVLVVYPIMEQDEWIKATEGELLPKDPLHGIPGAEGLLPAETAKRHGPPDEEDDAA